MSLEDSYVSSQDCYSKQKKKSEQTLRSAASGRTNASRFPAHTEHSTRRSKHQEMRGQGALPGASRRDRAAGTASGRARAGRRAAGKHVRTPTPVNVVIAAVRT